MPRLPIAILLRCVGAGRGDAGPKSWRIAFHASGRTDLTALQHLLLGVNAHINVDLGFAIVEAGLDPIAFRPDFDEINRILGQLMTRAQSALNEVSTAMHGLDRLLGRADEYLGLFVLGRARDQAWRTAVLADALPAATRGALEASIDAAAAQLARRIADPGLPTSAAIALMLALESWTVGSLLDRFDGLAAQP